MSYQFRIATEHDLGTIVQLIQDRITWMDEKKLKQWNTTHYMDCYPRTYFLKCIQDKQFYLFYSDKNLMGITALFEEDYRWIKDMRFYYIHHLTTSLNMPGAGKIILKKCEDIAKQDLKIGLRLDCQKENEKLNLYYHALGYRFVEEIVDGEYVGNKLEKLFY